MPHSCASSSSYGSSVPPYRAIVAEYRGYLDAKRCQAPTSSRTRLALRGALPARRLEACR